MYARDISRDIMRDRTRHETTRPPMPALLASIPGIEPAEEFRYVTRYVAGATPLVELDNPAAVAAIRAQGREWLTREVAFEYLLADADRNPGNLIQLPGGRIVGLDFAAAFRRTGSFIDTTGGVWRFLSPPDRMALKLDERTLRGILATRDDLLGAVPPGYRATLERRLDKFQAFLDDADARAEGYTLDMMDAVIDDITTP